ncbi:hypothetical protein MVLG_01864 [Microbotryum lychnidis-dioicae p1A1 Lamole]|uniref:Uncharacterized protein n=1 Tax=Microbotryum lychnidis-dioicae (strain p1A1 Lamole / MvSl-1064) TaxID=683840 RepID=U5H3E5_USTV1|nr:hypothetical protein MVLG_01864 [Microbotryum lychnidis-dioicae p1A1 Lamole]|eukprot:KDE07958.1 hypothetical protein MVLG_01864 [Microbotryum lychnidis-dioicae p1A1 Lamole]
MIQTPLSAFMGTRKGAPRSRARRLLPARDLFQDHFATSALGFMPYFANGYGLQLNIAIKSPPALNWANSAFATAVPPMQGDARSYSASSASQPSTFSSSSPSLHCPHHAMSSLSSLEESITNAGDSSFRAGCVVRDDAPGHVLDQVNAHLTYTRPLLDSSQRFQDSQPGSQYSYYTNYRPSSASASSSSSVMQGSAYPDSSKQSATPMAHYHDDPSTSLHKKRKVNVESLTRDVCQRDLAAGGLSSQPNNLPVELMIEVVCVSCAAKYQRCSDCGGGGGGRVGIGKCRCKELFRDGRRNCSLSHVRQGLHDMQAYEIWSTSQLPPEELDFMIAAMWDVTISAIMSMSAIPDILEAPTPLARTYDELQRYAVDTWSVFEPLARMDQSAEHYIRRYFALRWTTPHKRKKKGAADLKVALFAFGAR